MKATKDRPSVQTSAAGPSGNGTDASVGDRKPRVLLACQTYYPDFAGGVLQFRRYLPGLRERGIDVAVYTEGGNDGAADHAQDMSDIPVHRSSARNRWLTHRTFQFYASIPRWCDGPDRRPDIVQFLTLPIFSLHGLSGLRRRGIRTILSGMMVSTLEGGKLLRILRRHLRGLPLRNADRVVAGGSAMRDYFRELGAREPIEVIPPGVDLSRFRPPSGVEEVMVLRRKLGLPRDGLILLFVGSIKPRKRPDLLLRAWGRLATRHSHIHLVAVGPRPAPGGKYGQYPARVDRLVGDSRAGDRVQFTGLVSNVEEYMRAADILVFPSRREGAPNAVVEAMASRLPVVQTSYIGLPEEFGEPNVHYVLSGDQPADLAASIESLIVAEERRRGLAESGCALVSKTMDLELIVDRYAAVYREMASRGSAAHRAAAIS